MTLPLRMLLEMKFGNTSSLRRGKSWTDAIYSLKIKVRKKLMFGCFGKYKLVFGRFGKYELMFGRFGKLMFLCV